MIGTAGCHLLRCRASRERVASSAVFRGFRRLCLFLYGIGNIDRGAGGYGFFHGFDAFAIELQGTSSKRGGPGPPVDPPAPPRNLFDNAEYAWAAAVALRSVDFKD